MNSQTTPPTAPQYQFNAIKTKDCYYLGLATGYGFPSHLLFDGKRAEPAFEAGWARVPKLPEKIEAEKPAKRTLLYWRLKDGFVPSDKLPAQLDKSHFGSRYWYEEDRINGDIYSLYEAIFDEGRPYLETVPFSISVVAKIKGVWEPIKVEHAIEQDFVTKLSVLPVLRVNYPCALSKAETYNVIRSHVKKHINPKYASITSDYDFCFTVKKRIQITEPIAYQKDISRYGARKAKYVTAYCSDRDVTLYEAAPAPYQSYTVVTPFSGKNYKEMQKNIKTFLDDLMERINEPVRECACCQGRGVVFDGPITPKK